MSRFFTFLLFSVLLTSGIFAQSGSVELRDNAGVLISTHSSVTEAYNAIPATITQKYLIEILTPYNGSTESFPIVLLNKTGASETNTITIRPAAGNTGEILTAALSGNSTLIFDNCEYVIVDGRPGGTGDIPDLTIENTITTGTATYTVHFRNGASHNTLKYCITKNYTMDAAGPRNIYFGLSASNPNGNSYNLIEKCNVVGGRSGFGTSGTAGSPNTGNIIRNCTIEGFGYAGIWLVGNTQSTVIEGNIIQQHTGYSTSIVQGILTASSGAQGETVIRNNEIMNIQMTSTSTSASVKGIVASVSAGATLNIYNNFVSLPLDNLNAGSVFGIQVQGTTDFTCNIFYNSVYIAGTHNSGTSGNITSAAMNKTSTGANAIFNMKNNLFVNHRTGGNTAAYHVGGSVTAAGTLDVDYNLYFADGGSNAYHAAWSGAFFTDLALYKTAAAPNEANSIFKKAHFISANNLHLADSSIADVDLTATPLASITTDIDGDLRSATTPYKGADEAATPIPVELAALSASVNGNSVILSWTTITELNNSGFEVERNRNNAGWFKAGFVRGAGNSTEPKNYNFNDAGLSSGSYIYRIKQIDNDGSSKYYYLTDAVEISIPEVFSLSQNYPNPFNPSTTIRYSVPSASRVTIKLYNMLGAEAAVLVDEMKEPGQYSLEINSSKTAGLSSGVYIYSMQAQNFSQSRKMIMLK